MKNFDKWLDEHPGRYTIPALKMGYRAALEWVKRGLEFEYNSASDVYTAIKEELDGRP